MPLAAPPRELRSLTGLRSVGALFVFLFHTTAFGDRESGWWRIADVGFCGVSFFFVLSGLVLAWATTPGRGARRFYTRRFARIYPAHAVMSVVAVGLYLHWQPKLEPAGGILLSLLLLQAWVPSVVLLQAGNGVSWSLSCEAFFYACFPWLHRTLVRWTPRRRVTAAAILTAASMAAGISVGLRLAPKWDLFVYVNPLARLSEFVLGLVLGLALREGFRPRVRPVHGWLLLGLGWGAALLVGATRDWFPYRGVSDALVLPAFVLLIAAYAGADVRGTRTIFARPALVYLGRLSFAFYLVHQVALGLVERAVAWHGTGTRGAVLRLLADLAVSLIAAIALHHLVELPAQRLLTRARKPRSGVYRTSVPDPGVGGSARVTFHAVDGARLGRRIRALQERDVSMPVLSLDDRRLP